MKPLKALLLFGLTVIVSGTFVEHGRHKRTINLLSNWPIPRKNVQGAQIMGNPNEKFIKESREQLTSLPNSQYPIYKIHKYNGIHVKPVTAQEIVPKIIQSTNIGSSSIVGANITPEQLKSTGYLPSNTEISRTRLLIDPFINLRDSNIRKSVRQSSSYRPSNLRNQSFNNQGPPTVTIKNQEVKGIFPFKSLPELPSLPEAQLFKLPSKINPYPNQDKVAYKLKTVHHLSVPLKEDIRDRTIKIDSFNKFNPIVVEQTNTPIEEDIISSSDNVLTSASEKHEVVVDINGNPINNPIPKSDNKKMDSKQHDNEKATKVPPRRFTPSRKRYPNFGNNS